MKALESHFISARALQILLRNPLRQRTSANSYQSGNRCSMRSNIVSLRSVSTFPRICIASEIEQRFQRASGPPGVSQSVQLKTRFDARGLTITKKPRRKLNGLRGGFGSGDNPHRAILIKARGVQRCLAHYCAARRRESGCARPRCRHADLHGVARGNLQWQADTVPCLRHPHHGAAGRPAEGAILPDHRGPALGPCRAI